MITRIVTTLAAVALLVLTGSAAFASTGSGEGPITDVVGTFRTVAADGTMSPWQTATVNEGPDGDGLRLARGERVEVVGTGSSCLDPVTQTRHTADVDHFAECHVDPAPVPASWAR